MPRSTPSFDAGDGEIVGQSSYCGSGCLHNEGLEDISKDLLLKKTRPWVTLELKATVIPRILTVI